MTPKSGGACNLTGKGTTLPFITASVIGVAGNIVTSYSALCFDFSRKIYEIGNHVLNTEVRDYTAPRSHEKGTTHNEELTAANVRGLIPHEQETDMNAFLKPPAGITSFSSQI